MKKHTIEIKPSQIPISTGTHYYALTSSIHIPDWVHICNAINKLSFELEKRNAGKEHKNHRGKIENESDGRYMDIGELTSYIKRTKGAVRNLVLKRAIPYRKQAGRLIFLKDEIDQWLQMAPGKTLDEIKNDI